VTKKSQTSEDVKPNRNPADIVPPQTGGDGTGALAAGRDELIIAPSDEDFYLDVFPSETPTEPAPSKRLTRSSAALATPESAPAPAPVPAVDDVHSERTVETVGVVVPRTDPSEPPSPPALAAAAIAEITPVEPDHFASAPAVDDRPDGIARDRSAAALLIADLIDNHVQLEWHEAVAIAQHLCEVMAREPGANLHRSLVEPWNIEITDSGEVQVLPRGSSSDPIVKQVGRVLRVLLHDSIAPAELRLVASQASFEVPVYASLDELSAALRHFERPDHTDAIRSAFNRGLEAKLSGLPAGDHSAGTAVVATEPIEPRPPAKRVAAAKAVVARRTSTRRRSRLWMPLARAVAAILVAGTGVFVTIYYAGRLDVRSSGGSPLPPQPTPAARRGVPPVQTSGAAPTLSVPLVTDRAPTPPAATPPPPVRGTAGTRALVPTAPRPAPSPAREAATSVPVAGGTPGNVARPAPASDSIEASLRRAGALLAEGRAGEAAVIVDGVVMKNPLYQPDPARLTPETLAAFQSSKRLLLPAMARRYLQEGRVAFDAGDFMLAITKGERAQALLRDADIDPAAEDLSDELMNLITGATTARTLEETRIYTIADRDVTPPRPIGRQLSSASLSGRAPLTGRLELVVDRNGDVETVRLETPVNGYHDRMIVSAAKAWHYRPAMRKGRPVRYGMVMSITLPDF
jgi:hypothetical protein